MSEDTRGTMPSPQFTAGTNPNLQIGLSAAESMKAAYDSEAAFKQDLSYFLKLSQPGAIPEEEMGMARDAATKLINSCINCAQCANQVACGLTPQTLEAVSESGAVTVRNMLDFLRGSNAAMEGVKHILSSEEGHEIADELAIHGNELTIENLNAFRTNAKDYFDFKGKPTVPQPPTEIVLEPPVTEQQQAEVPVEKQVTPVTQVPPESSTAQIEPNEAHHAEEAVVEVPSGVVAQKATEAPTSISEAKKPEPSKPQAESTEEHSKSDSESARVTEKLVQEPRQETPEVEIKAPPKRELDKMQEVVKTTITPNFDKKRKTGVTMQTTQVSEKTAQKFKKHIQETVQPPRPEKPGSQKKPEYVRLENTVYTNKSADKTKRQEEKHHVQTVKQNREIKPVTVFSSREKHERPKIKKESKDSKDHTKSVETQTKKKSERKSAKNEIKLPLPEKLKRTLKRKIFLHSHEDNPFKKNRTNQKKQRIETANHQTKRVNMPLVEKQVPKSLHPKIVKKYKVEIRRNQKPRPKNKSGEYNLRINKKIVTEKHGKIAENKRKLKPDEREKIQPDTHKIQINGRPHVLKTAEQRQIFSFTKTRITTNASELMQMPDLLEKILLILYQLPRQKIKEDETFMRSYWDIPPEERLLMQMQPIHIQQIIRPFIIALLYFSPEQSSPSKS